jgi:hypothetical protein
MNHISRVTAAVLSLSLALPALAADEGIIIRTNERTLEQVLTAYAAIPPVRYRPPAERWERLPQTARRLREGGTLRIVMLGDSIVNDTSRSCWNLIVERRHPTCRIEKTTCVRGSTGCWWYKEPGRVQKYVLDHQPDLVIIGGISQRNDVESIRAVIRQIREEIRPDLLLMTGAFGSTDPRRDDQWQRISDPNHYRGPGSPTHNSALAGPSPNTNEGVWGPHLGLRFSWYQHMRPWRGDRHGSPDPKPTRRSGCGRAFP